VEPSPKYGVAYLVHDLIPLFRTPKTTPKAGNSHRKEVRGDNEQVSKRKKAEEQVDVEMKEREPETPPPAPVIVTVPAAPLEQTRVVPAPRRQLVQLRAQLYASPSRTASYIPYLGGAEYRATIMAAPHVLVRVINPNLLVAWTEGSLRSAQNLGSLLGNRFPEIVIKGLNKCTTWGNMNELWYVTLKAGASVSKE
jgi:hypothetical protein